ncbi:MAG: type III-B CRISPR module RAMP protein Cmr6 [Oscillospiraceae bacterium]|nr:type III-B CRISPR module RAMP protein Cmr6 [Oscillospiraceae bacterium]
MNGVIKTVRPYPDGNGSGFGFVRSDEGKEYWFRYNKNDRFSSGKKVTFDLRQSRKDPRKQDAYNIRLTGHYLPNDTSKLLSSIADDKIENTSLKVEKYAYIADNLKVRDEKKYSAAEMNVLEAVNLSQKTSHLCAGTGIALTTTLGSRMVVGLGSVSVFETGIILHKPYGFPYIPGSSIKGALRHLIIREAFEGCENSAMSCETFCEAFGTQENRGNLFFYDAYPKYIDRLELDIMNPHFSEYYMNGKSPTDTYAPTPIKFYAVPAGTEFTFRIGGGTGTMVGNVSIHSWLEMLLKYSGLGAKTSVGYGWMRQLQ